MPDMRVAVLLFIFTVGCAEDMNTTNETNPSTTTAITTDTSTTTTTTITVPLANTSGATSPSTMTVVVGADTSNNTNATETTVALTAGKVDLNTTSTTAIPTTTTRTTSTLPLSENHVVVSGSLVTEVGDMTDEERNSFTSNADVKKAFTKSVAELCSVTEDSVEIEFSWVDKLVTERRRLGGRRLKAKQLKVMYKAVVPKEAAESIKANIVATHLSTLASSIKGNFVASGTGSFPQNFSVTSISVPITTTTSVTTTTGTGSLTNGSSGNATAQIAISSSHTLLHHTMAHVVTVALAAAAVW